MNDGVALRPTGAGAFTADIRIGLRSTPYLRDHGFQDLVVVPGAFYVEKARSLDRLLSRRTPGVVRDVTFNRPITLAADDTTIRVDIREHHDGRVAYAFHEGGGASAGARVPAATLLVERDTAPTPATGAQAVPVEAFQSPPAVQVDAHRFYQRLRENGNQYGPAFQRVVSLWRRGGETLGRLTVARPDQAEAAGLHPSVLDSLTQLLASFMMDGGKTFILQSIERVEVRDGVLPDTLWAHAILPEAGGADGGKRLGSVRAFDERGRQCLALSGVAFTYLDGAAQAAEAPATRLVISANFTAEPIRDSLEFWGTQLGASLQPEFAPYNQVFQQLLDPHSALRQNRDGVNAILVGLEEWAGERATGGALNPERAAQRLADRRPYVLPNGLAVVQLNSYETDYLYQEIFEDRVYLRHGIELADDATVLDIGANIGLFSLFVMSRCGNPTVYAFEPAPAAYEALRANCEAYGSSVRALNLGVADRPKSATLTYYDRSSVFSGFHADEAEDSAAVQAVVRNALSSAPATGGESMEDHVAELTAGRLERTTHQCRLTTVSDVIRENRIDRIDLLKIDAEKSEWEVLQGIADQDWPKIAQIVVEIHDRAGETQKRVEALLVARGFHCVVEQERLLEHSGLCNLYATRSAPAAPETRAPGLQRNVRDLCAALREGLRHTAAPLILCICPRTPAAESDAGLKATLDAAEQLLLSEAATIPQVHSIGSTSLRTRYPLQDYYDPHSHHLGHVPYTPRGYAAIGTALTRALFALTSGKRFKVIALDCDNTLWKGVCGEDGPLGLELGPPYRALQQFMVDQMRAGMLLCLCSKNTERDVLAVFDQRSDMVLQREHLASWRVNWSSKSANLRSLAQELNLGLDSFIFLDDNPAECAEVRGNCPDVLTLQLPARAESWPAFLHHVWAFDHVATTEEDLGRTVMYQQNARRQALRQRTGSLKEFIQGLDLRVEIAEPTHDELARVSQLTVRTNQFNFTTMRRSEPEIRDFLQRNDAAGLAVHVSDRFGSYGLVGVVLYEALADRYRVDTLLLSCRVLGKGVEYAVLSDLGRRALRDGRRSVELIYRPTERNAPARAFLQDIAPEHHTGSDDSWILAADRLAALEYDPDKGEAQAEPVAAPSPAPGTRAAPWGFGTHDPTELLPRIAEQLNDTDGIAHAVEAYRLRNETRESPVEVAPRGPLEAALLDIWRRILARSRIGPHDNFFEVGGTSLRAVQIIALIKQELQRDLSIVSLFECPTVALLAERLGAAPDAPDRAAASQARNRGHRRRQALKRETA